MICRKLAIAADEDYIAQCQAQGLYPMACHLGLELVFSPLIEEIRERGDVKSYPICSVFDNNLCFSL